MVSDTLAATLRRLLAGSLCCYSVIDHKCIYLLSVPPVLLPVMKICRTQIDDGLLPEELNQEGIPSYSPATLEPALSRMKGGARGGKR